MKVGFDLSQTAHRGGVAVYTKTLAMELVKHPKQAELVFFYSSLRRPYRGDLPNVKQFKFPPTVFEFLFNRVRNIPIEKFLGPIDIFHSSDWIQPPTKALKITTYHDLVPLKYPQWSHPKIVAVAKRRLRLVESEIDKVIAVSNSTKLDLMELSSIPEEKIVVIYEGVDKKFSPKTSSEILEFRKKYDLPEKFILAIGGVGERRNLSQVKEACREFNLVITGETIPWLEEEEIPTLFSAATILLYPSLYEGFGLPILEAMASGTVVITSNLSSMPEVGGDATLYVDPTNLSDITDKVKLLMKDDKFRQSFVQKGLKQAGKFSWELCAKKTLDVYNSF